MVSIIESKNYIPIHGTSGNGPTSMDCYIEVVYQMMVNRTPNSLRHNVMMLMMYPN